MKRLRSHFRAGSKDSPATTMISDEFWDLGEDLCVDQEIEVQPTSDDKTEDNKSVISFRDHEERAVFEQQLTQLQEQLVHVMIDNQNLSRELKQYQEQKTVDRLERELEQERHRCRTLEKQLHDFSKNYSSKSKSERARKSGTGDCASAEVAEDLSRTQDNAGQRGSHLPQQKSKPSRFDALWEKLMGAMYEVFDDFSEDPGSPEEVSEGDPLTVAKLKENIKRFKTAFTPYLGTVKGIYNILSWKSPAYTFIVVLAYMFLVWKGWLMPVFFVLLAFRLGLNFLQHKGMKINFRFLDSGDSSETEDKDLGLSDKFNLVIQVARKVQNALGAAADGLEKIKNLLTWKYPPGTRRIFTGLCMSVLFCSIFSASQLLRIVGLGLGIKIFFVNFLYNKYPRLKRKHDTMNKLWKALPTDAQYIKSCEKSTIDKYILVGHDSDEERLVQELELEIDQSDDNKEFRELFSLPPTECPLQGWLSGKRCTLLPKDRSLTGLISRTGKLYLTKSFICFERSKVPSPKNIIIPLTDITDIQKVKPYSRLPGKGMAIQITVRSDNRDNILVFGGIINREQAINSILDAGTQMKLPWATGLPTDGQRDSDHGNSEVRRRLSDMRSSKIQKFTMAAYYEDSD